MKIVQLITRMIVGGAQRIALETAAYLRARGVDAEIWCGPQTGPEGSLADEATSRGVPVRIIAHLVKEIDPLRDLAALDLLKREIRTARIDLLHTHSSKAGIIGRRAGRAAGVPRIVHTVHGWGFSPRTPWPARMAFIAAERAAARWTDRMISVSDAVRDEGLQHRIGRPEIYRTIRPGIEMTPFVDLERIRRRGGEVRSDLGIPTDAFVAGSIGRLSPQKNPGLIIEAARALPGIHWLWIGDGPLRGSLERRIRREGIEARIHLVGLKTNPADSLGALDLFVLPSLWEGAPLTILEAMAAALPIVAAEVGGVSEIMPLPPAGLRFPVGDVEGFIEAIAAVARDPEAAKLRAIELRPQVLLDRSLERMIDATFALYGELLAPARIPAGKPLPTSRPSK